MSIRSAFVTILSQKQKIIDHACASVYNPEHMDAPATFGAFLTTKLHIPLAPPTFVLRPRLVARLDELYEQRALGVVAAPAGFGKSTLVAAWARAQALPAAWLSLDADDNDPQQFFSGLGAALARVVPGHAGLDEIVALARSRQPPPLSALIPLLINTLAEHLTVPTLLVLDDYHVVEAPQIHQAMTVLVEHHPRHLHLVLTTRVDPPLPLARLRARGQLVELRQSDLRFTPDEAATFLQATQPLPLTREQIAALDTRTEGWIAGLQLVALSMQGQRDLNAFIDSFAGSNRFILDYLVEEVLQNQPTAIQQFLLKTSLLERLCAPLCDAVMQAEGSQEILETLERRNLFLIPLDAARRWYRYHHLFAHVLLRRLGQSEPETLPTLHRRASHWFESHALFPEAISHALAGRDLEHAAELVAQAAMPTLDRGQITTVEGWFTALPPDFIAAHPRLAVLSAWTELALGRGDVEPLLQAAQARLQGALDDPSKRLRAEIAAIRALLASFWDDTTRATAFATEALASLPEDETFVSQFAYHSLGRAALTLGDMPTARAHLTKAVRLSRAETNPSMTAVSLNALAATFYLQGALRQAAAAYAESLGMLTADDHPLPFMGSIVALQALGAIAYEKNDLQTAARSWTVARELSHPLRAVHTEIDAICNLARLAQAEDDFARAIELVTQARALADQMPGPEAWRAELRERAALAETHLLLAQGNHTAAARWAEVHAGQLEIPPGSYPGPQIQTIYLMLARVWIAQGQADSALNLLAHLEPIAERHALDLIEILILQSLARRARGDRRMALEPLERALDLAAPEGYIRQFVDKGETMRVLLQQVQRGLAGPKLNPAQARRLDYVSDLLGAFDGEKVPGTPQPAPASPTARHTKALVEPLTNREVEVLHLLAAGYTNQQISDSLFISNGTTKKHLASIFGKLNVNKRTQALIRAREVGLLD